MFAHSLEGELNAFGVHPQGRNFLLLRVAGEKGYVVSCHVDVILRQQHVCAFFLLFFLA